MKKLLLMTMALVAFSVNAQNVTFGAKAGLNLASLSGDDVSNLDSRTAFHLGATAEFELSDTFSVQPELLYSAQGAKGDFLGAPGATYALDYINLPVMLKYYVSEGFSLEAGPQIGFLMNAEIELDGQSLDLKDAVQSTDFAFNLGAGYKLDSGLNFGLRYSMGLTNIFEVDDVTSDAKNSAFQLSVGYNF